MYVAPESALVTDTEPALNTKDTQFFIMFGASARHESSFKSAINKYRGNEVKIILESCFLLTSWYDMALGHFEVKTCK